MSFLEASFLPNERIYFSTYSSVRHWNKNILDINKNTVNNEKTAPGLRSGRELERELSKMHFSPADPVQIRQFSLHGLQMFSVVSPMDSKRCSWVRFVEER